MVLTPIIHVLILWGALALAPGSGYPILFGIGVATLFDVFKELRASAKDEPRPLPDVP